VVKFVEFEVSPMIVPETVGRRPILLRLALKTRTPFRFAAMLESVSPDVTV
jgi:hypothetical protein